MSKFRTGFALLAGALIVVAPQGSGARAETPDELRAGYVEDISNAHELAAFAKKYKSPEAYVAAASLLLKVEAQTKGKMGTPPKELTIIDANMKETKEEVKGANLKAQVRAWFDDARGLAEGDEITKDKEAKKKLYASVENLIALAEKRDYQDPADKGVGDRGKAGGPANVVRGINAGDTHVYHWKFEGGQLAAVGLAANNKLRITIVGPNGGELFGLSGVRAVYRWGPKKTDTFIVRVHNGTKQAATYNLITN